MKNKLLGKYSVVAEWLRMLDTMSDNIYSFL